jgi:peptidoglycan/xylan/chitin deacetylase (PgdA/CDA1 family)
MNSVLIHFRRASLLGVLLSLEISSSAQTSLPLENPDFEKGLSGWTVRNGTPECFKVQPEAASMGSGGLHIAGDTKSPATLVSNPVAIQPGKIYRMVCWGRFQESKNGEKVDITALKMEFHAADGRELPAMPVPKFHDHGNISINNQGFDPITLEAIAPEGAVKANLAVQAWRNSAADLDDVKLLEMSDPEAEIPIDIAALTAEVKANPSRGKALPKIVLKLDDLVRRTDPWAKIADALKKKQVPANFGIICNSLETPAPGYVPFIQSLQASGLVEFWNHGYDHKAADLGNGKSAPEFSGTPYEYQKKHMDDSLRLVREKLNLSLPTFGAPFNQTDDSTAKIIEENPEIKVWVFGQPGYRGAKTALYRVNSIGLENPTFAASFPKFLEGYAHNRGRGYLILQGHPDHWNEERFNQVLQIVDFLVRQKAPFVTFSSFVPKASP